IWFILGMIPFFLWVRDPKQSTVSVFKVTDAIKSLGQTLSHLPAQRSLMAYLVSSMFYRDALNGIFTFGGLYAAGVLEWSVVDTGIFGILAIITGAIFAWIGGRADAKFGPKPVITICVLTLTVVAVLVVFVNREAVFGIPVGPDSSLPDVAFYILGGTIGAAGGALQSASRTMMVRQANPDRMTEAFGLYALAGKATSFLAPFLIFFVTSATGSQVLGI
ncbi:MAG: MFS transporter, partial [Halocynthiibacter sp.]